MNCWGGAKIVIVATMSVFSKGFQNAAADRSLWVQALPCSSAATLPQHQDVEAWWLCVKEKIPEDPKTTHQEVLLTVDFPVDVVERLSS